MLVSNIPPTTTGDDDNNSIVAAIEMENCGVDVEQAPQKSVCHETTCKAEIENEIQNEGECSNALQEVAFLGTASLNKISDVQDTSKEADNHTVTILNLQEQVIFLRRELCQMQQNVLQWKRKIHGSSSGSDGAAWGNMVKCSHRQGS